MMTLLQVSVWLIYWRHCYPHPYLEKDFQHRHIFRITPMHKFFNRWSKRVAQLSLSPSTSSVKFWRRPLFKCVLNLDGSTTKPSIPQKLSVTTTYVICAVDAIGYSGWGHHLRKQYYQLHHHSNSQIHSTQPVSTTNIWYHNSVYTGSAVLRWILLCLYQSYKNWVISFPEFDNRCGQIDFLIPMKKWGMELCAMAIGCMCCMIHAQWISNQKIDNYVIVDFYATHPQSNHKGQLLNSTQDMVPH